MAVRGVGEHVRIGDRLNWKARQRPLRDASRKRKYIVFSHLSICKSAEREGSVRATSAGESPGQDRSRRVSVCKCAELEDFYKVDVVEAASPGVPQKAITIVRYGGSDVTETMVAIPWEEMQGK